MSSQIGMADSVSATKTSRYIVLPDDIKLAVSSSCQIQSPYTKKLARLESKSFVKHMIHLRYILRILYETMVIVYKF